MEFIVVVRVRLCRSFMQWKAEFDAHREARAKTGVHDEFCYPIVGEQAALYAVRTSSPRLVHDMVYDAEIRPIVEASGFVIGSEQVTLCELSGDGGNWGRRT
jgi:hypothetical protein